MHVMGSVSPANERGGFSLQDEGIAAVVLTSPPSPPPKSSDIKGSWTTPAPPAPSAPLLLPPPPPPPPPPPLPGLGEPTGGDLRKKKRVRSFFWKTIPEEQVKGRANLWTQGQVQEQYQIDIQTIEELFGQNDCQSNTTATLTKGGKIRSSFRETKEEVSILDSKRGMNIGIFLKQFKRSNQTIVDDIRLGNSEHYGAEPLRELLKLLPDTDEVKKLKTYRGDLSKLSLADSFMYLLIQVPSYSVRIESMLLKEEFPGACETMERDITILSSATKELMCCEELHAVLHLVLQAGNILNAGGYAGNAVGFKLSSLLSLADTKANKPGMNLLHFVALEAQKKDEKLLEFPLKLTHVQAAARISLETLDAELQWMTTRMRSVEESVQRDTELLQQLDSFLQRATSSLCSLRCGRQQLKKEGSELIDFFCEDRDMFRLDDCFSIFHTFCTRFTDAVKWNIEREAKEAHRRHLQELEDQKRHSWAGGEKIGGVFRMRCSSETDMSQNNKAGVLMELWANKSHPCSPPLNNSHSPPSHSGSLRRSRMSPSSSPSIAADRELSMFLEMATRDRRGAQQRGGGEARTALPLASSESGLRSPGLSPQSRAHSPRLKMCSIPQNEQPHVDPVTQQTPSSPPKTSWSLKNANSHNTTTTYLSYDQVTMEPTSDSNQQFDHNNNGKDQLNLGFSSQTTLSDHQTQSALRREPTRLNKADQDLSGRIICSGERHEHSTTATGNMSVVLETRTLVAELKVFDKVTTLTNCNRVHHTSRLQDDIVITDLEEEEVDKSRIQTAKNNAQIGNTEKSSLSQREEDDVREEKVVVWCVTGVCEAAGELTHDGNTHTQTDKDQCGSDNQGGSQQASSPTANCTTVELQSANEKPVPVPISSQPVPVSRCDDLSLRVSSPGWSPTEPASANAAPSLTTDASEEGNEEETNQVEETDEEKDVESLPKQSTDDMSRNKTTSCHMTSENKEAASSTNGKSELSPKNLPTLKAQRTGMKTTNAASTPNKSKPVRTLTNSENHSMRRVVPISRTGRGAPSKHPENSPGHHQGSSSTTAPTSLTTSNLNSSSLRRRQRPSTAPSSRRSSIHKTLDNKDSKEQNQDLQRRPSVQKTLTKPKPQPEEKMCRSTLRELTLAGEGGGGSVSAPATPLHKVPNLSSSPLPGFARSTASSSFRRNHTILGLDSSPKSSPKTTTSSSVPLSGSSSPYIPAGSLRVSTTGNPCSSSPLKRSQSIRVHPHSPHHSSLPPSKGHRRNDSGSFSDKSTHSRDSGKATRPNWR